MANKTLREFVLENYVGDPEYDDYLEEKYGLETAKAVGGAVGRAASAGARSLGKRLARGAKAAYYTPRAAEPKKHGTEVYHDADDVGPHRHAREVGAKIVYDRPADRNAHKMAMRHYQEASRHKAEHDRHAASEKHHSEQALSHAAGGRASEAQFHAQQAMKARGDKALAKKDWAYHEDKGNKWRRAARTVGPHKDLANIEGQTHKASGRQTFTSRPKENKPQQNAPRPQQQQHQPKPAQHSYPGAGAQPAWNGNRGE